MSFANAGGGVGGVGFPSERLLRLAKRVLIIVLTNSKNVSIEV